MTRIVRSARRRPWRTGIAGAIAVVLALVAVPRSNDTCAGAQTIEIGQVLQGSTLEAADDYQATLWPVIPGGAEHAVAAEGPDTVYRLVLSEDIPLAEVLVAAPFRASVYAFPVVTGDEFFDPSKCGSAFGQPGLNMAGSGAHLRLSNEEFGGELGTTWFIVVDGWTNFDVGTYNITTAVSAWNPLEENDEGAIISSIQARIAAAEQKLSGELATLNAKILELTAQIDNLESTIANHVRFRGGGGGGSGPPTSPSPRPSPSATTNPPPTPDRVRNGPCAGLEFGSTQPKPNGDGKIFVGTSGMDVIEGTDGPDIICGLGGDDFLWGAGGKDLIVGNRGSDTIRGKRGPDSVLGGAGGDTLLGGPEDDVLKGGNGRDSLEGSSGNDLLNGGANRDSCAPGRGDDTVVNCE